MRTFTLINKDGAKYDVTTKNSIFFHSITGLGFEKESEFQRIDERFKLLKSQYAQQKIEGIVRFWQPNAEQAYFDFAQFCHTIQSPAMFPQAVMRTHMWTEQGSFCHPNIFHMKTITEMVI